MSFEKLKETVIDRSLCTHCGTCVGICPEGSLAIHDPLGKCIPVLVKDCSKCGRCLEICPGGGIDFSQFNKEIFGKTSSSSLGNFLKLYMAHAMDKEIRIRASSGGVVTALLLHLLEKGEIDGAVVLDEDKSSPWMPKVKIAHNKEEILSATQSKYVLSPINTILKEIRGKDKRFAIVALPCQVHGLRKLQGVDSEFKQKVKYIIGLYCGNTLYFQAVKSLLDRFKIKDLSALQSVKYREGKWPGNFQVKLKDGRMFRVDKFTFNYLSFFYTVPRCLWCVDLANELSDVSVGDGWLYKDKRGDLGWSVLICRTSKGEKIVESAQKNGILDIEKISEQEALDMHSHLLDYKKTGALLRIERRKDRGFAVPYYGLVALPSTLKRKLLECFLDYILWISLLPLSAKIINRLPLPLLRIVLHKGRELLRKRTKIRE